MMRPRGGKNLWAVVRQDAHRVVAEEDMMRKCARPNPENPLPVFKSPKTLTVRHVSDIPMRLQSAHMGDIIVFEAGTYAVNLSIVQNGVTLRAAPDAVVTLTSEKTTVVDLNADTCRLEGFKIVGISETLPAVTVSRGSPEIVNCDIVGGGGCIFVKKGDPTIKNCKIHNSRKYGINFTSTSGRVEESEIFGNGDAGILIEKAAANPWIHQCNIHDGKGCGVASIEYGRGVLFECRITNNGCPGLFVSANAQPVVFRCTINNNRAPGISVDAAASGFIEQNVLYGNADQDIEILNQANPIIKYNTLKNGVGSGISVSKGGLGVIEYNQIENYSVAGVITSNQGDPTVQGNTFKYGELCSRDDSAAILVHLSGKGHIKKNMMAGWGGSSVLRRPSVYEFGKKQPETGRFPILVRHGCKPEIENNEVA